MSAMMWFPVGVVVASVVWAFLLGRYWKTVSATQSLWLADIEDALQENKRLSAALRESIAQFRDGSASKTMFRCTRCGNNEVEAWEACCERSPCPMEVI